MKVFWKRPVVLLPFLMAVLGGLLLSADALAARPTDAAAAAAMGFTSLKELVSQENYASLGFQSVDEVAKAKLGGPISVYMIQYDELSKLDPKAEPKTALHNLKQSLFPVFVGGSVRAAIVVRQAADGTWDVVSMGDAAIAKLLEDAKAAHAKSSNQKHEYMLIKVPALYQMFLAHTDGAGKMHFVTVQEDKALGSAKQGEARPARTVLDLLTTLAKNTKPLAKPLAKPTP
jgi:hypothetical protein